mmetsp:Transcript_34236/g.79653  ORF Transcript_34236/g.79653 Transcript_34236/m.79653 type:complete len:270 (+) Transcript_34236:117-926(+)
MAKPAADVTDLQQELQDEGYPSWARKASATAIDGAVVGNTLGFLVGAFPGMCVGAASGGVAGVLGAGLFAPVLRPAMKLAMSAFPGKFVLSANCATNNMIGKLCGGPRGGLGKAETGQERIDQNTDPNEVVPEASGPEAPAQEAPVTDVEVPVRSAEMDEVSEDSKALKPEAPVLVLPTDLASCKEMMDNAMVRASAAGAQGATAGAEVGGAVIGTAIAIPGAVIGSVIGGVVGLCVDIHERYIQLNLASTTAPKGADKEEGTECGKPA